MTRTAKHDWPMVRLGDVLRAAGVPEKIASPETESFVTVKMHGEGAVLRNIGAGKTPAAFTGYRVKEGQFIYSRIDARNGAFALIPKSLDGAVVSKDFPIFEIDESRCMSKYLHYFATSGILAAKAKALSVGATNRQRVKEEAFLRFEIPLPPLDEQRRIAAILGEVEAAITAIKSQLSELSSIPFGMDDRKFELVALSELVDIRSSQVDPTSEPYLAMPHIAPNNLSSGSDDIVRVKSAAEDGVTSGKYAFKAGDILYSKIRPYLNKVSVAAYGGVCSADMYALVPRNKVQTDWIVWQLRSSRFLAYAASSSGRASIPKINRKALGAFKVQLVEPAVLEQFNREQNVKKALANFVRAKLHLLQELQSSLSTRAFQGEL